MTRTTVYLAREYEDPKANTLADVFQNINGPDHPALTIEFGEEGQMPKIEIPPGEYIDVYIKGYESHIHTNDTDRFSIKVNGEEVNGGNLCQYAGYNVRVLVEGYKFSMPPGQTFTIDVRGKEVNEDGD